MPMNNFSSHRNKKIDFRLFEGVAIATSSPTYMNFRISCALRRRFHQSQLYFLCCTLKRRMLKRFVSKTSSWKAQSTPLEFCWSVFTIFKMFAGLVCVSGWNPKTLSPTFTSVLITCYFLCRAYHAFFQDFLRLQFYAHIIRKWFGNCRFAIGGQHTRNKSEMWWW